jgi:hypothetical protein
LAKWLAIREDKNMKPEFEDRNIRLKETKEENRVIDTSQTYL